MARRGGTYVIRRADQLAALGSPVRWAVAESLSVYGPSSVGQQQDTLIGASFDSDLARIVAADPNGLAIYDAAAHRWQNRLPIGTAGLPRQLYDSCYCPAPCGAETCCRQLQIGTIHSSGFVRKKWKGGVTYS